ncbi:flagellar hook-associated protein FlgK [Pontitalea aquivivens]|uniref:flagellar hook-associated protein FlgK n=1 Tax=Pontitalea aquivivens TaxID=3388663 RepID=UPI00397114B2
MSITGALNNALSGLAASARGAELVASNTANVMTVGYAPRALSLAASSLGGDGGGVRILGTARLVNEAILADRRLADAEAGHAKRITEFFVSFESRIGLPGEEGSLSAWLASLEGSLIEAASRPDSEARLSNVLDALTGVASKLNTLSRSIQASRLEADAEIGRQVSFLNDSLAKIDELNSDILAQRVVGRDASALMDQRQVLVDKISEIVPLRQINRENGQISLFSTGGATLLDGSPVEIGFTKATVIAADMDWSTGTLSGLTMNGLPILSLEAGILGGGTLSASFSVRDELAPKVQENLDAFARDLITRFSNSAVDQTLLSGSPGIFTDSGDAFDTSFEKGLAGRISVNELANPASGGVLWRIRDGVGAASPGPVGDASLLLSLLSTFSESQIPASGNFYGASRNPSGLAADILSQVSTSRISAEAHQSYSVAKQEALVETELSSGVDTDWEMQRLLQIEKAYAANARVIQAVDAMLGAILEI